ncbi:MAG TPA: NAD+ synthase [Acidobacteriota bacterium]|nr:NAD+ synthase [Acidobacteriota bacterium]
MKLTPSLFEIDFSEIQNRICRFIKEYVENVGAKGIVLGLSGGIDSATIAALSSLAIGGENILGLMLPENENFNQKDVDDAKVVAEQFHLETQVCNMSDALNGIYGAIPLFDQSDKLCKGNVKARTRMIYLYYYANKQSRIVCGSSDKSETMMGYFTKWGDAAADIAPIMDLYKTQVRKLAIYLGIQKELAQKPSTPGLWPNQLADSELGIKYETLDLMLFGLERFMTTEEVAEQLNIDKVLVDKVKSRWLANEHKRRMPIAPKIGYRSVGNDFRLPRHTY